LKKVTCDPVRADRRFSHLVPESLSLPLIEKAPCLQPVITPTYDMYVVAMNRDWKQNENINAFNLNTGITVFIKTKT